MFFSVKRGETKVIYSNTLASNITVTGLTSLPVNITSSNTVVEVSPSSTQPCGIYYGRLTIETVSSTIETEDIYIFVVGHYRVEQHVFENQNLKGFLNEDASTLHNVTLSIFVCEEVEETQAEYKRFEYTDLYDMPLECLYECPKIEIENNPQQSIRHQRATVVFSNTFPFRKVFERYFNLQHLPFQDTFTTDTLFSFLRITDNSGGILCEGIIDTQDGRLQYQFTDLIQEAKRKEQTQNLTETFSYQLSQSITLEVYQSSTILSVLPTIDNQTPSITYSSNLLYSSGKGFIDYLYNQVSNTIFDNISNILDSFSRYFSSSSFILAECGLYRGEGKTLMQGYNTLCMVVPDLNGSEHSLAFVDVVEGLVEFRKFVRSEAYGIGQMFNGERKSLNIEPTRGLKGNEGKFPNKDKEYPFSFFQLDTAQDILNKITETLHLYPSFETRQVTSPIPRKEYEYVIDVRFLRPFFTEKTFVYDRSHRRFIPETDNKLSILSVQKTLNQVNEGEIDDRSLILRQLDQVTPITVTAKEVYGAGNPWPGKSLNDKFHKKIEKILEEKNPVRAVSSRLNKKEYTLLFSSKRLTERYYSDYSVINNTLNRFVCFLYSSSLPTTITSYPLYFAICFSDTPRLYDFYAEAFVDYARITQSSVRREVYEQVQLNNLDTTKINPGLIIETDLIDNVTHRFRIEKAIVDSAGNSAILTLSKIPETFYTVSNQPPNQSVKLLYDEVRNTSLPLQFRRHGIPRYRLYQNPPSTLPITAGSLGNEEQVLFAYRSSSNPNMLLNEYEGVDVVFPPNHQVKMYRDNKLLFTFSTTSLTQRLSDNVFTQNYHHNLGTYTFQVTSPSGEVSHCRFDVVKGCLVSRGRRCYLKIEKMADGQVSISPFSPVSDVDYYIAFKVAYQGEGRVVRLYNGRVIDIFVKDDGFYITHIAKPGSYYVELKEKRNKIYEMFVKIEYRNPNLNVEVLLDGNPVPVTYNTSKGYTDLYFDFETTISPLPSLIGLCPNDTSFIGISYIKAVEVSFPTNPLPIIRVLFDLSFDNILALSGDEPYNSQLTETSFMVDDNPSSSMPLFITPSTVSPFISIRPVEVLGLIQV